MKAIVYERYGGPEVLELRDVDPPSVGDRDVLVRVRAAGVAAGDWHLLTADMFAVRLFQGLFRPKRPILGWELAGVVQEVGASVTRFRPGDEVFGECRQAGAFAEFARVAEDTLAAKPARLSFEEAAAVPVSGLTALQGLRDHGRIRAGQKVLVHGASGGVGTWAVQIAKAYDTEVTGTCRGEKIDHVRSLGADHVLDYAKEDFTKRAERYDLILDLAGKQPIAACRRALTPDGIYVAAAGAPMRTLRVVLFGGKRMTGFVAKPGRADLETLAAWLEAGTIRPVVDRTFPLAGVPDAIRRLGEGRVRGKIVIAVDGGAAPERGGRGPGR